MRKTNVLLLLGILASPAWAGTTCGGLSALDNLADNTWIRLNLDGQPDPPRQTFHGSITIDKVRDRVYLYGSDTHGESDNNSIWYFELAECTWNRVYPDDDPSTYIQDTGAPLTGGDFWPKTSTGHPVASHSFDGMRYIPGRDAILVLQLPSHNFTMVPDIFSSPGEYTLWMFHTDTLQWELIRKLMPDNTFPEFTRLGTTPDGSLTVLSLGEETYSFDWNTQTFSAYNTSGTPPQTHHAGIEYDTYLQQFIVIGGSGDKAIRAFDPTTQTWTLVEASGGPTIHYVDPEDGDFFNMNGVNAGYDTANQVLIVHAANPVDEGDNTFDNSSGAADTWVRSSVTDVWTKMLSSEAGDTVPPHFGFSFRGEYDVNHNVFYFVTENDSSFSRTDIWAYRYKTKDSSSEDDTPASVPANISAQTVSSTQIDVSWNASSDPESGVASYNIYRDDVLLTNTSATSYSNTGLSPATTYDYRISAINGVNLESAKSATASATTNTGTPGPDTTPPTVPANVTAQALSPSQISLAWNASADPQSGVSSYRIYRNNMLLTTITGTGHVDTGLTPETTYSYQVAAVNGENLESARSGIVSATTPAAPPVPDTTPPTIPANVTAQAVSTSRIDVGWSASSDPQSGVTGYRIYRNNTLLTTTTGTTYSDTGLAAATTYTYQISAINGEDLESARSNGVSATTTPPGPLPNNLFEDDFETN